jgi:hypothetical protein
MCVHGARARSAAKTNKNLLQCRHPKLFRYLDVFARAEQRFILYYCWAFLNSEMTADAATKYSNGNVSVV